MTPERWQRIEALVEKALVLELDDQLHLLDAECGSDDELRQQVAALLKSHDLVETFMEAPAALDLVAADGGIAGDPLTEPRRGALRDLEAIGPYRVLGEIGRGGMGSVARAARVDGEYERQVAIKLIRPGADSRSVARRFRSERQILANLDHPHIARLLDGGTTADGRPYFVMELIEGTRIDEYCDGQRLTIRERLDLFGEVCSAVAYAHRNLVVHRDLKPGNILVTAEGTPKLLDFGIAKLLDPAAFPHTVEATRSGLSPMTPPYASPEQILGQPITTASDVYSLGVLLYKLLAGSLPFQRAGLLPQELLEGLVREPTRPSVTATQPSEDATSDGATSISYQRKLLPQQLSRRLAGDLDNIILKALRREPERRYGSVEQLAADLERHLEGLPVSARRASLKYRAGKFLHRYRLGVASTAVLLTLIAGSAVQITAQRDLAEQERDRAEQVVSTLVDLFETLDPSETTGNSITAREILDRGAKDIAVELRGQPRTQAAVQTAIGKVYRNLGLYDQAQPLLEDALEKRRSLLGEEHLDVAESLFELAELYSKQSDIRAGALHGDALSIRRKKLEPDDIDIAQSLLGIGDDHLNEGNPTRAIESFHQALAITERALGPTHVEVAEILISIADGHQRNTRSGAGEPLLRQALEILESALGSRHPRLVDVLVGLAWTDCEKGLFVQGKIFGSRALEIQENHLGREHPELNTALDTLAYCHAEQGNYSEAEALLSRNVQVTRDIFGGESLSVSVSLHNLSLVYFRAGDYTRARDALVESIAIAEAIDSHHPGLVRSLNHLGRVLTKQAEFEAAEKVYQRSLSVSEDQMSEAPRDQAVRLIRAMSFAGLGEVHRKQGNDAMAQNEYSLALSILESNEPSEKPMLLLTQAQALTHLGRTEEARPIIDELQSRGWKHPDFLELSREYGY